MNVFKKYLVVILFFVLLGVGVFIVEKMINRKTVISLDVNQNIGQPRTSPIVSAYGNVKHVLMVLGENQNYKDVMGNTKDMPYLNLLANTYAYASEYYGNAHPSMGNYFMLTAGTMFSKKDNFSDEVKDDNIIRHLITAGKTWKEYSENLPSVGYIGTDVNGYIEHHNPLSYYSDVRENDIMRKNLVPFSQFAIDSANHQLPDFAFIVPNNEENAHSCQGFICSNSDKLAVFDHWLKVNIDPLIQNPDFNVHGNGILIITFDEADSSDKMNGGGHTVWVAVGPDVKKGYIGSNVYQHENTLRFVLEQLGLTSFPGQAADAASMGEFLVGN